MRKNIITLVTVLFVGLSANAQKVEFEEYDLSNGLHVILHQDNSAPVIALEVLYNVGSKDEVDGKTGMAHFYEHLLFTGTQNIPRGKWSEIQSSRGGSGNATTNWDRTNYYETFPSNELKLALWMESERLLHPIVDQKAVDTQNEVVKEEKRQRMDNAPYGKIQYGMVYKHLFDKHNYGRPLIGFIKDLDNAKLEEFKAFYDKWYMPNNAVLVLAGDFQKKEAKSLIKSYFGTIPSRTLPKRVKIIEPERTKEKRVTEYDSNIQLPAVVLMHKTPSMRDREAKVLDVISTILSDGKSSRLQKKLVENKKKALAVFSFGRAMVDYSVYTIGAIPLGKNSLDDLIKEMDEEILKLQTELISDEDLQKVRNKFENRFVSSNSSVQGIASSLASNYMLMGDTHRINNELEIINSITKEEIRAVAKKYLAKSRRVVIDYLPTSKKK
ncbi:Predicted Zn-dependent peptidase [Tenacibaculum sp. MAR_2010_89]|uniref:M16 family metallopeptidase n=1 Tax=Tenacibaculum sp. MAR_2010_89 TaxID=1250198 RepID=UPI000898A8B0|nr:pitrilysin family protein [Tenacibaculum sp. MAR_2010_89]SED91507.1 Predicted Zn-dependent peptidase [Tenacibaculum sp. MAR_2010_89]